MPPLPKPLPRARGEVSNPVANAKSTDANPLMPTKSAAQEEAEEEEKLQAVWMKVDADGSGLLDEGEVRQVMIDMGKEFSDEEFAEVMKEVDQDGSGELDFGEFLAWWQKQDPEAQKQLMMLQGLDFDEL